ncbi:MAG: general secretion pathway protein GspF, partial [Planctomycetota bacterium]|nr:general secretion pathway protein GspF [Planctomycetota bacterium]
AATIEMGGYDYHGGARAEGEVKDFRAGRCMGACIEYAARVGVPLMLYVFSDGSLSSNGAIDTSPDGRDKGEWVSDNSSTAGSFFLVFNPAGSAQLRTSPGKTAAQHQQIGYMDSGANVARGATPVANNVNLLVNAVILNYMALHGEEGNFATLFPSHELGDATARDNLTAFQQITSGTIGPLLPT